MNAAPHFGADLIRGSPVPQAGTADRPPHGQPVTEFVLDGGTIHAIRLNRIDDIDTDIDQIRYQLGEVAVAVVKDQ